MKLTIAYFASALAFVSSPAFAVDLPDYGSKNFTPSVDTPAHFANEDLPVSARTADTTERDWSAVDAIAPARPVGRYRSAHRGVGRHGRYVLVHESGRHVAAGSASRTHETRMLSVHYSTVSARTTGATKTISAKHARSGARHASAAAHDAAT